MTDPIEPLIPLPFAFNTPQGVTRDVSQTLTQFLNNLIYNSTTPLSFETYPEDIYTAPLIREHHDSYLYYIETHSLVLNSEEPPFSIPFTSLKNRSDTFRKNIYPNNIYIPIAKVFTTFLNHLQENNNLLTKHVFNLLQYKTFFKKNPFSIFLILNNLELLKIILTIGSLLIFFKFIIFNINSFKILPSIQKPKNKFKFILSSSENFLDTTTNSFGTRSSKMLVSTFLNSFLQMNFYLLLLILIPNTNSIIISSIFHLLIFNILPMTPIVLIKVLTFLPLFVLIPNNLTYLPQLIQLPTSLFKLFLHLQMP